MQLRVLDHSRVVPPIGEEGDSFAEPGRLGDLVAWRGHAARLPRPERDDPRAVELVAEAEAVEPPRQVADPAGQRSLRIADDETLLAARRDHEQRATVRRP